MLGLAAVGFRHGHNWSLVEGLTKTGQARVVAVAEDHPPLAARAAETYGATVFDSVEALLDATDVDIASLAPVNNRKAACICALAERGVHCFVDKPLTTTLAGLERIESAVRAAGVVCVMALPVRFSPAHWTAKRLIDEGRIGRIVSVHAARSHNLHPERRQPWELSIEENGGPLIDLGCHDYDYVAWCVGDRPVSVCGSQTLARYADLTGFADAAQMFVRFAGGASATVSSDWLTPDGAKGGTTGVRIVGTQGAIRIDEHEGELALLTADSGWRTVPHDEGIPDIYTDFIAAVHGGTAVVTTEQCLAVSRTLLLGRRAAATGRLIDLDTASAGAG